MPPYGADLGYTRRDELRFEQKKLVAYWFAPPPVTPDPEMSDKDASDENASETSDSYPFPRVFVSNLLVEELSPAAAAVVRKYTAAADPAAVAAAAREGKCPWPRPTLEDYDLLARESEYAAWTLVNGYGLNHVALSVHRLAGSIADSSGDGGEDDDDGVRGDDDGRVVTIDYRQLTINSSLFSVLFFFSSLRLLQLLYSRRLDTLPPSSAHRSATLVTRVKMRSSAV